MSGEKNVGFFPQNALRAMVAKAAKSQSKVSDDTMAPKECSSFFSYPSLSSVSAGNSSVRQRARSQGLRRCLSR